VAPYFAWGIYLDDNSGGVDVVGNIVVRAGRVAINVHNGRENLIENNIFAGGPSHQAQFNGWTGRSVLWRTLYPGMVAGYDSVKDQPAWRTMRNIEVGPERAVLSDGLIMAGNVFRRNIAYSRESLSNLFESRNPRPHLLLSGGLLHPFGVLRAVRVERFGGVRRGSRCISPRDPRK
jgi:parallel beta-helix repeat protein